MSRTFHSTTTLESSYPWLSDHIPILYPVIIIDSAPFQSQKSALSWMINFISI